MLACAGTGTVKQGATFGRPPSRHVAVGPREAGANRFQHVASEGFSRESIQWERSTRDIHTHVVHTTGHTQPNSTSALRQSYSYRRPPLPPLGLRWVLTCAHGARGPGPRRDLPAKRKRKRARAGRPMAARGAGSGRRRQRGSRSWAAPLTAAAAWRRLPVHQTCQGDQ